MKWVPGRPPGLPLRSLPSSRRPASFHLDVGRVFLVFILVEEAGVVAAAFTLGAALDLAAGGVVDLHQQGLIFIEPEDQELPFGQVAGACERFPPLAQEDGVVQRVLCQDPGGAVRAALHLQPEAFRPTIRHGHGEDVLQVQAAVRAAVEIHDEFERRHTGVGSVPGCRGGRSAAASSSPAASHAAT